MIKDAIRYKSGEDYLIEGYQGESILCERLRELGLGTGFEFNYWGRAPLNGPHLLKFNNTLIALRDDEISCLITKKI